MLPELPPIDPTEEPHDAASYAAENAAAWLEAPPCSREDYETAVAWFRRFRVLLGQVLMVRHPDLAASLMHAEKMRVLGELREAKAIGLGEAEYLEAVHRAGEWRRYALRMREALETVEHHDCAVRGAVGPCDCAIGKALAENAPATGRTD